MATVYNTLELPGSEIARRAKVKLELIASADPSVTAPGWETATDVMVLGKWAATADQAGYWSADLTPNDEITPANSCYRVTEQHPSHRNPIVYCVEVGASGGWVGDLLKTVPDDLPPSYSDDLEELTGFHAVMTEDYPTATSYDHGPAIRTEYSELLLLEVP